MQKYFYPIFKLPTFYERDYVKEELPLYVKWWLLGKAGRELSEILTGSEFTLLHTLNKKFKILQIKGNTEQEQLSGKNLANASSEFTITGSQRYRDISCVAEPGNYICSIESWETDGSETLSAVMLINANDSTVLNFQLSNTTKSVACNISSDVAKIRIYSQNGYQPSGGVTTTVKNLMFRKSTEDDTYEPYCGGIPAPNSRLRMSC